MDLSPVDAPAVPADFHLKLRQRFFKKFSDAHQESESFKKSICLFKGIEAIPKNCEDTDHFVEQESTFWYLFGIKETGCYAIIHNDSGEATLFVPRLDEAYKMWMYVKPVHQFQKEAHARQVLFTDELQGFISTLKPD